MIKERSLYISALEKFDPGLEGKKRSTKKIASSDIRSHGKEIAFSYVPLFINSADLDFFDREIGIINRILVKMTKRYIADKEYRKIFGFSPDMESLICLPCGYEETIPIGRYDLFFDEKTGEYAFCEFNTDGSGGMSIDRGVTDAILESFSEDLKGGIESAFENRKLLPFETVSKMTDEIIRIYKSDESAKDDPVFCVTDFKEQGVLNDFDRFIKAFEKRGYKARFTDVRDLFFDGEKLVDITDGTVIDAIYRRAVTSDVLERMEESTDFISAVKAKKVVLIGHFRTSVAHSKTVMSVMHRAETKKFLTDEENEYVKKHIPRTYMMRKSEITDELMAEFLNNKDEWIIKPEEGFGSKGVICGKDVSENEWKSVLTGSMEQKNIIQKYLKPCLVPMIGPNDKRVNYYNLMLGVYQAGGRAVGFYSRGGNSGIIDYAHGGMCVSTVFVK